MDDIVQTHFALPIVLLSIVSQYMSIRARYDTPG